MRSARWLPILFVVVVLPLLVGTAVVVVAESRSRGESGESVDTANLGEGTVPSEDVVLPRTMAREVLADWDARRAEAWAAGDAVALSGLYVPSSVAGQRDVEMLVAWTRRGLVVRDLRTQLLRLDVRRAGPERLVLDVTDRLVGGVAVGPGVRQALPVDRASRRVIVLRRAGELWQVAAVRGAGAPAPASR
ncbi:hypothetical protein [Nocardioides ochotonae]|uniref:hypothetical protein n=1 Tax=Nocardioides ochotonae TaxID=2685869 RepID=UPI00140E9445|nr:hypothetical protein [Nocardioides ochotonae]